jgi:hypothetical protein
MAIHMLSIPSDDQETLIDAGFHESPYHGDHMFSRFTRNHTVYECITLEEPFISNPRVTWIQRNPDHGPVYLATRGGNDSWRTGEKECATVEQAILWLEEHP